MREDRRLYNVSTAHRPYLCNRFLHRDRGGTPCISSESSLRSSSRVARVRRRERGISFWRKKGGGGSLSSEWINGGLPWGRYRRMSGGRPRLAPFFSASNADTDGKSISTLAQRRFRVLLPATDLWSGVTDTLLPPTRLIKLQPPGKSSSTVA